MADVTNIKSVFDDTFVALVFIDKEIFIRDSLIDIEHRVKYKGDFFYVTLLSNKKMLVNKNLILRAYVI